ncbi:UDP-glucose 4-epimerase GalE [Thalassotalea ganghwensis]
MKILVTGGAGYIGSHTTLCLLEQGFDVVVLDNLVNSNIEALKRVERLANKSVSFIHGDIRDRHLLEEIFSTDNFSAVIHFAALKAVGESTTMPLSYYQNNVHGSLTLLEVMAKYHINDFIFSSSATVYGEEKAVPYTENMTLGRPASPYGASKVMVERILEDHCQANDDFRAVSLRYFNPIGAHPSGIIGEDPKGIPNNLLPYIAQVAVGKREKLSIFGNDYPTPDGSCLRDYLHVMDLGRGHVSALNWLLDNPDFSGSEAFNLGRGKGISVFEIVQSFERVTGQKIPFEVVARRAGDLPAFWADATKANKLLNWVAEYDLPDMIADTWRWQSSNPSGYGE